MKILVVDDNRSSAEAMSRILRKQGHDVTTLYDGASAIESLRDDPPELVFTDLRMEPVGGMEVLRAARELTPPAEVVVFTAFGAVDKAVEAMQMGARDFLTKPISVDQILDRVASLGGGRANGDAFAQKPGVAGALLGTLQALADVPSPVWIEGEVGSGRIAAARKLHELGGARSPFTVVDPARDADLPSGMVVLPDVDELSHDAQQQLVRTLKRLRPDTRLVATARPGAQQRVTDGQLRSDLYFTLAVVVVSLPPLRERVDELPSLFEAALVESCAKYGRPVPAVTDEMNAALAAHSWPGNLKELHNLAERTAVLGPSGFTLTPQQRASEGTLDASLFTEDFKLSDHLEGIEARLLELALDAADGDRALAGKLLGVERNTLRYKLKKYGFLP
ncbi:MAG: sigma-54-dependent Fis family transcriptional regulator [Myxococcales bacterium]|nr:sigma-54-dependent Fis family transcriptional regulator [Myxococcales bacterium]